MPTTFEHDPTRKPPARGDVSTAASNAKRTERTSGSSSNIAEKRGDFSCTAGTPDHIHALDSAAHAPDNGVHLAAYLSGRPSICNGRTRELPAVVHTRRGRGSNARSEATHDTSVYLRGFKSHEDSRFHRAAGHRTPRDLRHNTGMGAYDFVCGGVEWRVIENTRTEIGGFHSIPLITTGRVRTNLQMGGAGGLAAGSTRAQPVCLAVHAHVVPDEAMAHAVIRAWQPGGFSCSTLRRHQPFRNRCHFIPHEKVGENRTPDVFLAG